MKGKSQKILIQTEKRRTQVGGEKNLRKKFSCIFIERRRCRYKRKIGKPLLIAERKNLPGEASRVRLGVHFEGYFATKKSPTARSCKKKRVFRKKKVQAKVATGRGKKTKDWSNGGIKQPDFQIGEWKLQVKGTSTNNPIVDLIVQKDYLNRPIEGEKVHPRSGQNS